MSLETQKIPPPPPPPTPTSQRPSAPARAASPTSPRPSAVVPTSPQSSPNRRSASPPPARPPPTTSSRPPSTRPLTGSPPSRRRQAVKDEQHDDAMDTLVEQLRREQARVQEKVAYNDELREQIEQMKSMINRLQRQQPMSRSSSPGSSANDDSRSDDDGYYSYESRPSSPINSSRRRVHTPSHPEPPSMARPRSRSQRPSSPNSSRPPAPNVSIPRPPSSSVAARVQKKSSGPPAPERLAKADLARLSTALDPTKIERWITDFIETIVDYSPDTAWLLKLPAPSARLALDHYDHLRALDRWAARQALNTFQTEKPHVKLLLNATTEEAITARTSGIELLAYVRDRSAFCSGETARLRMLQFEAKKYFNQSMDEPTIHLQADELRSDFLALPAEKTSIPSNALLKALLSKLPDNVALQRTLLEDKLVEAGAMRSPPPWTFDQLVHVVAQHLLVAAHRSGISTTSGLQVNAVEAKGKRGYDHGLRPDQMKCPPRTSRPPRRPRAPRRSLGCLRRPQASSPALRPTQRGHASRSTFRFSTCRQQARKCIYACVFGRIILLLK